MSAHDHDPELNKGRYRTALTSPRKNIVAFKEERRIKSPERIAEEEAYEKALNDKPRVTDIKLIIPFYEKDALVPKYVDEITINTDQRPGIMHAVQALMDSNDQISEDLWNFMKESYVPMHWDMEKFKILMMRPSIERLVICRELIRMEINQRIFENT